MKLINWELLSNPYNWLIVWLMLGIGLAAVAIVRPFSLTNFTDINLGGTD